MEKVLVFNIEDYRLEQIYKICGQMHVAMIVIEESEQAQTIEELLKHPVYRRDSKQNEKQNVKQQNHAEVIGQLVDSEQEKHEESLVFMCDLSEKHMGKMLASLRTQNIAVEYKAVLTPINRKWTGSRLLAHMALEKSQQSI